MAKTNFQTPNLDRLAAEGTRFTDYSATSDKFSEAQAALMGGKPGTLAAGEPTVAARLQQVGYRTGLIGEWMLGQEPWTQGFDEFTGFRTEEEARNYYAESFWRYVPAGVQDANNHTFAAHNGPESIYENAGGKMGRFLPEVFVGAAGNFIRVNVPDFANHYQPFFLLLSLTVPESATPGKDDYPVPTDAPFTGENWPQPQQKFGRPCWTRLDADVGRLLEQLKNFGMDKQCGLWFWPHGVAPAPFAHTNLDFLKLPGEVRGGESEDRLRVPLIVRWPVHVAAGRVCTLSCSAPDFAPTALQIGYGKAAANFTGKSLLPFLTARQETNRSASPNSPVRTGTP